MTLHPMTALRSEIFSIRRTRRHLSGISWSSAHERIHLRLNRPDYLLYLQLYQVAALISRQWPKTWGSLAIGTHAFVAGGRADQLRRSLKHGLYAFYLSLGPLVIALNQRLRTRQ